MAEVLRFGFVFPMATGHLNPSLPVARALRKQGHEVHYLSREEMRPLVEKTGADFSSCQEWQSELYEGRETDIMGCFRSVAMEMGTAGEPMMVAMLKTAPRHLELQMPGTIRWMQKLKPHLVMFCPFMNAEAAFAAQFLQIPSVGLWTFAGSGSMLGIVDSFLMQTGLETEEILRRVEGFQPMLESQQRFKETYGIDLDHRGFLQPKGFLKTLCNTRFNLVTTSKDLEDPLPAELARCYEGASFINVGPLLEKPDAVLETPEAVKEIQAAREAGRLVILVSMGTILTSNTEDVGWRSIPRDGTEQPTGLTGKQLCQSAWSGAFDAFGSEDEEAPLLVVAVGPQEDALEDLQVPRNARTYAYLPQVEVLKAGVDLFLTHGGQNSFMESLMAGTPVVVCPGFADQIANAYKAEAAQVGLQVPRPKPLHGEELRAMADYRGAVALALQRVLSEELFRERAERVGRELRLQGGVERATELLLDVAAGPRLLGHLEVKAKAAKA